MTFCLCVGKALGCCFGSRVWKCGSGHVPVCVGAKGMTIKPTEGRAGALEERWAFAILPSRSLKKPLHHCPEASGNFFLFEREIRKKGNPAEKKVQTISHGAASYASRSGLTSMRNTDMGIRASMLRRMRRPGGIILN